MLVLVEIGVLMFLVDLLNLLFTSFHILVHGYILVVYMVLPQWLSKVA
jgi:hypothetical protein